VILNIKSLRRAIEEPSLALGIAQCASTQVDNSKNQLSPKLRVVLPTALVAGRYNKLPASEIKPERGATDAGQKLLNT
jgi:hypothetical protein